MFAPENLARVQGLLEVAGVGTAQQRAVLARPSTLRAGRQVLAKKCVQCHDLRTILSRPHPPDAWRRVVGRMAERSVILNRITEPEELAVTAYLIAVSPQLQRSMREQRQDTLTAEKARDAASSLSKAAPPAGRPVVAAAAVSAGLPASPKPAAVDLARARRVFETKCVLCHSLQIVQESPPRTEPDARNLVARMVTNGLDASREELDLIVRYVLTLGAAK